MAIFDVPSGCDVWFVLRTRAIATYPELAIAAKDGLAGNQSRVALASAWFSFHRQCLPFGSRWDSYEER